MPRLGHLLNAGLLALCVVTSHGAAIEAKDVEVRDVDTVTTDITEWGATCTNRNLTISIARTSATVFNESSYGHEVFQSLTNKEILMDGTYVISTRECVPKEATKESIQLLMHGATYTKHMWEFAYKPERYGWTRKFNLEGYTTFAFDSLGAGNSTRPDAIHEVQTQAHVEIVKQIIEQLRAGSIDNKQWKRVIFVGFSIGAATANSLATQYPTHADQSILLGLSWYEKYVYPALLYMERDQANRINKTRWGNIPDFYTTMPSLITRDFSHLYGEYDVNVSFVDYRDLDCDTLGEAVSFFFHADYAPEYRNSVFLAVGNNDVTFCGLSCDGHQLEVYDRFPKASDHFVKAYPNTGHNILLHYSGQDMLNDVSAFMEKHENDPLIR